jgi:hypothetical protein
VIEAWEAAGDIVFDLASMDRYANVQNSAPFSVYPLPARQRVKLMTAALWLSSSVNISAVLRYLESRGWKLLKGPEEHAESVDPEKPHEVPIATLKKGALTTDLPMPWIGRVANEFLSPKTLADMLDALLAAGPVVTVQEAGPRSAAHIPAISSRTDSARVSCAGVIYGRGVRPA